MLAFGAGGIEVALAMAGEPLYLQMPEIWGVRLVGELPDWVSAKDVDPGDAAPPRCREVDPEFGTRGLVGDEAPFRHDRRSGR